MQEYFLCLIVAVGILFDASRAFTLPSPHFFGVSSPYPHETVFRYARRRNGHLCAGLGQPSVEIGQKTAVKQKVGQKTTSIQKASTVAKPKTRKEQDFEEHPLYKVMLIGDEEADQAHTIERLCAILEDMDENLAATVFKSAQVAGKAMCGKYPLEHAEMYVEQLLRSDPIIYSELEEENE